MERVLEVAADPQKPYGDVQYADPGYQADKKKRYPLTDEKTCRAAWSYINQADNAAKYTPAQLARIKGKIKAALKRYGVETAEEVKAGAAQMLAVELARPGTWHLKTGRRTFTNEDLQDAADFFAASGQTRIPIGFGHSDPRFDGDPAFGWVGNIRYTEDAQGPVLLGDLVDMDEWVAAAAPSRWPNRSIEGFVNLEWNGRTYRLALTRLALLGSTPPAMPTLRSLADLREAIAAAAEQSADCEPIAASAPDESIEDPEDEQTPAPEAEEVEEEKEAGMDPAKIREALGLSADASDEEVGTAWTAAGLPTAAPPEPTAEPVAIAAAAAKAGMRVVSDSVWDEQQKTIKTLSEFMDQTKRNARDEVIAKGVKDGKFTPAQKPTFVALWDKDPDGTRQLIEETLTPNTALAVMASGYAGDTEDVDGEYAALFGKVG